MATVCSGTVQLCGLRLANLNADGSLKEGAGNLYVTDQQVSLTAEVELAEGEDLELKSGCGALLVAFKDCDRIKRLNMGLQIGTIEPELHHMVVPGVLHTDGGNTIGYGYPRVGTAPCQDGISAEAWVRNIYNGAPHPTYPYIRFVFPRTTWQIGNRELQNDTIPYDFSGQASENSEWGTGPGEDYPAVLGERIASFAFDVDGPPDAVCGAQALALAS